MIEIITPNENDVLLGRGGKSFDHIGNRKLRDLATVYFERYNTAKKNDKTSVAQDIVEHIQNLGGRFLKKEQQPLEEGSDSCWVEVSNKVAVEKASQMIRDIRRTNCISSTSAVGSKRKHHHWSSSQELSSFHCNSPLPDASHYSHPSPHKMMRRNWIDNSTSSYSLPSWGLTSDPIGPASLRRMVMNRMIGTSNRSMNDISTSRNGFFDFPAPTPAVVGARRADPPNMMLQQHYVTPSLIHPALAAASLQDIKVDLMKQLVKRSEEMNFWL